MKQRSQTAEIRQFLIDHIEQHHADIIRIAADHFSYTRQAIQRHINALVREGTVESTGEGRARRYSLRPISTFYFRLDVAGLNEDVPWRDRIRPHLEDVSENVREIAEYGFTEMLNNVIDHSGSPSVIVNFTRTAADVTIDMHDYGVGIFKKIMTECKLDDEVSAIWELAKGKLTTDPARHSGEGVYFTLRMCDDFTLLSGSLWFHHNQQNEDWLIENRASSTAGTHVTMKIALSTKRTRREVWDEFADPEKFDYSFSKTRFPVSLLQYGHENLISRSQAKRLLQRFDKFREVLLDFADVRLIGQAFADEIFRVFKNANRDVKIIPINTSEEVRKMISRVTHGDAPEITKPD